MTIEDDNDNKVSWLEIKSRFLLKEAIDLTTKTLYIEGPISHKSYIRFDKQLKLLESLNDDPITIELNSGGGEEYAMFAYIDRISGCTLPITIRATGLVASAAIPILASGTHRIATPLTSFMHHTSSYSVGYSRLVGHDTELKHAKEVEARVNKFLAKKTLKPYSFWTTTGKHTDFFFDTDFAKEIGLIDEIE